MSYDDGVRALQEGRFSDARGLFSLQLLHESDPTLKEQLQVMIATADILGGVTGSRDLQRLTELALFARTPFNSYLASYHLALHYLRTHEPLRARIYARKAVQYAERLNEPRRIVAALILQSDVAAELRDQAEALRHLEQALTIDDGSEATQFWRAIASHNYGYHLLISGAFDRAQEILLSTVEYFQRDGLPQSCLAESLINLSFACLKNGFLTRICG